MGGQVREQSSPGPDWVSQIYFESSEIYVWCPIHSAKIACTLRELNCGTCKNYF